MWLVSIESKLTKNKTCPIQRIEFIRTEFDQLIYYILMQSVAIFQNCYTNTVRLSQEWNGHYWRYLSSNVEWINQLIDNFLLTIITEVNISSIGLLTEANLIISESLWLTPGWRDRSIPATVIYGRFAVTPTGIYYISTRYIHDIPLRHHQKIRGHTASNCWNYFTDSVRFPNRKCFHLKCFWNVCFYRSNRGSMWSVENLFISNPFSSWASSCYQKMFKDLLESGLMVS